MLSHIRCWLWLIAEGVSCHAMPVNHSDVVDKKLRPLSLQLSTLDSFARCENKTVEGHQDQSATPTSNPTM